jgi:Cu/Ag efflux protein CusF
MSMVWRRSIAIALTVALSSAALAQGDAPSPVATRAQLASTFEEPNGKLYVRLKLLPRSKIPFSTLTFRVTDRALLAGIAQGSWVKFTASRVDGENAVTSLQAVDKCVRYQPCD